MTMDFLTLFKNDFLCVLPELYLCLSALILLVYGVIFSTSAFYKYPLLLRNVSWLSILCLAWTSALLLNAPVTHAVFFL
jgi:hypothetical protein